MADIPTVFGVFYGQPEDITEIFLEHEVYPMKLDAVGESDSLVVHNRENLEAWLERNFNEYGFKPMTVYLSEIQSG